MNNMEIKVSVKDIPEVIAQLEIADKNINDLQQENKQLKEESPYLYTNTEWEDILEYQGKSYIELDRFKTIQQENNQLKKEAEWNNKEIKHTKEIIIKNIKLLSELEEWLKEDIQICINQELDISKETDELILNKIQELKEKYK